MKKSKLTQLIENLTRKQRNDLYAFIQLPSNKLSPRDREICIKLMDLLIKPSVVGEDTLWEGILDKNERANKNKIKSRILKAMQRYLCMIQMESDINIRNSCLIKYYSAIQQEDLVQKTIKTGLKDIKKPVNRDKDSDIFEFWFFETGVNRDKEIRKYDSKIQMMEESLQNFYELNRIRLLSEKANRSKIINTHQDYKKNVDEIEAINQRSKSVHVRAYYHAFKLNNEKNDAYLHKLEEYLKTHGPYLKKPYLREFYEQMMNFCIRKINANQYSYAEKYLCYTENLEAIDQLLMNGILEIGRLRNTILACIISEQNERALNFLEKHAANIVETNGIERKPFLELNKAVIELYRGNPKKCFEHVWLFRNSSMFLKDVYFKLMSDNLLLKYYYQNGDYGDVLNGIETLRNYIKSQKKLSPERKRTQLSFLKTLKSMAELKSIDQRQVKGKVPIMDYLWLKRVLKWSDL
jgi:hypothetical protein